MNQGTGIVIPSKSEDTLVRRAEAQLEAPYAIKRGRGRTHIPFVALEVVFELRSFKSTTFSSFGKQAESVNCVVKGFDQKVDDEGRALFEHPTYGLVARSGSIKHPTFVVAESGETLLKCTEDDPQDEAKAELINEMLPLAKAEGDIVIIDGPLFKATFGTNYNVPANKRTGEDQLSLAPYQGFPMKENTWIDKRTGNLERGKDQVDWDQITGLESRVSWALRHHEEIGDEDLSAIVSKIPLASDAKARQAQGGSAVVQATQAAESDPFKTTV